MTMMIAFRLSVRHHFALREAHLINFLIFALDLVVMTTTIVLYAVIVGVIIILSSMIVVTVAMGMTILVGYRYALFVLLVF